MVATFVALVPAALGAPATGGPGADVLSGSPRADVISAKGGHDVLRGGRGNDRLLGGGGRDRLFGGTGRDALIGGRGGDLLRGGAGPDRLVGGPGRDLLIGGPGRDRIVARDGRPDRVRCGRGRDIVVADAHDRVSRDCEIVRRPGGVEGAASGGPSAAEEAAVLNPTDPTYEASWADEAAAVGAWTATHDGFEIRIDAPSADGTAEVLAAHPFNDPPAAGDIHLLTRVSVRYTGEGLVSFDADARFGAWDSATGEVYRVDEDECGWLDDPLPDRFIGDGAEVSGQVCWSVPAEAASRIVAVDDDLTGTPATVLALRP